MLSSQSTVYKGKVSLKFCTSIFETIFVLSYNILHNFALFEILCIYSLLYDKKIVHGVLKLI